MSARRRSALVLAGALSSFSCSDAREPAPACGQGGGCACPPSDPSCNPCKTGYRAALVGGQCVPTCSAPDFTCGEHGSCEDTPAGARCVCDPGRSGADCSGCASGLSPNAAGHCVAELSAPSLLTLSTVRDEVVLGALVPPAWDFRPLAAVASTVRDVAYDSTAERAYLLDDGRLFSLDLATGEALGLTDGQVDLGGALCLDPAGRRALTASAEAVYAVGLDSGDVRELAPFGARALEYDAEREIVIGVNTAGETFELAGAEPLTVGQAPALDSLAMAFDRAARRAYFLGTEAESDPARLLRYCSDTLTRFGAVPAWQARLALEPSGTEDPYLLDYRGIDPALVAVDLSGTALRGVRLTSEHPDTAVCIVAEGSSSAELTVETTAALRASFILVVAPNRRVAFDSRAPSSGEAGYSVVVHTERGLTISGPSAGISAYDGPAWSELGLTALGGFPERPSSRLVLMDWPSQAALRLNLSHPATGTALAWVGEAP